MALTDTDRRRFFLVTTLTLLALPALWWASRSEDSAAPNVAVAGAGIGVDVGADHETEAAATADGAVGTATAGDTALAATTATTPAPPAVSDSAAAGAQLPADDSLEPIAPVYLDGPSSNAGAGLSEIAVPARPAVERITTTATFRSDVVGGDVCAIPGMVNARTVTLVNLDNGHSVTCTTALRRGELGDEIAMSRQLFAQLADLTDAPIPVEIRR